MTLSPPMNTPARRDVQPGDVERIRTIAVRIDQLARRQTTHLTARRANDWTDEGIGAAAGGTGASSVGSYSNPTLAAVIAKNGPGATVNYRSILAHAPAFLASLEAALDELTRPTRAALEERESTFAPEAGTLPTAAGTCEACGRFCTGDTTTDDVIVRKSGAALCRTHHRTWTRRHARDHSLTIDDFVKSQRNVHGRGLTTDP